MEKILGIDQSFTNCAVTILNKDDENLIDFEVIKTSKELSHQQRIIKIIDELDKIVKENNITQVYLEGLSYGSNSITARPLAGLFYSMLVYFERNDVNYSEFSPKTIKKYATGTGNAKKMQMWDSIDKEEQIFLASKNHKKTTGLYDLADAYHIGKYGLMISETD